MFSRFLLALGVLLHVVADAAEWALLAGLLVVDKYVFFTVLTRIHLLGCPFKSLPLNLLDLDFIVKLFAIIHLWWHLVAPDVRRIHCGPREWRLTIALMHPGLLLLLIAPLRVGRHENRHVLLLVNLSVVVKLDLFV